MDASIREDIHTLIVFCFCEKVIIENKPTITDIVNFLIDYNSKYASYKEKLNEMLRNGKEQWHKEKDGTTLYWIEEILINDIINLIK